MNIRVEFLKRISFVGAVLAVSACAEMQQSTNQSYAADSDSNSNGQAALTSNSASALPKEGSSSTSVANANPTDISDDTTDDDTGGSTTQPSIKIDASQFKTMGVCTNCALGRDSGSQLLETTPQNNLTTLSNSATLPNSINVKTVSP